jgi:signal transduction histidine kinase
MYGRISLIFLLLMIVLGMVQIVLFVHYASVFFTETDQKLNRNLARDLAAKFQPFLKDTLDYEGIAHSFHEMMVMNPRVEFYLLDESGKILAYFADPEKIRRMDVDTGPIHKFLSADGGARLPLYGDDPRSNERRKPFSVTPINIGKAGSGYLYVILGGEQYDSVLSMLRDSYIIRTSTTALMVNFLVTAFIGLLLFFLLTRRLRRVIRAVRSFESGDFSVRIESGSGDEIGQLSEAFNKMAETIDANIAEIKKNDQLRRDLIANISHDLRSPLASVQGYLETIMIKDQQLKPAQRYNFLKTAYKNIERLNRLVAELLELSRLDANQVRPQPENFSIAELAQDVIQKFKPQAEKKKIKLELKFPPGIAMVTADIGMIERALSNLIENALIYTRENGEVVIELSKADNRVLVNVRDNGQGIDQDDLPHIFDRFYRGDKSRTSAGTGLGLAITKKIMEAHNSNIKVSSAINQGTTFTFEIESVPTVAGA